MRDLKTKIICLSIVAVVFYFIYNQPNTNKMEMNKRIKSAAELNASALRNTNAYINADMTTGMNVNANRSQKAQLDVDRLPLVEETSHIIPANEVLQTNYKDCNSKTEKELYTADAPLFNEKGPKNLVPLDVNDSTHRRVNFYA